MVKKKSLSKEKIKKKIDWFFHYKDSWNYLKESKNYIWFVVLLFSLLSILVFLGMQSQSINLKLLEQLEKLVLEFEGLNAFQTAVKIFLNNVGASLTGIVFGIFLGLFPIMLIILNSYVIGFVTSQSVQKEGILTLWKLVPHGIFELPAVFISFALGIKLGMFVFAKKPDKELKRRFLKSVKVFVLIIFPLLLIAAIIEGILVVLL